MMKNLAVQAIRPERRIINQSTVVDGPLVVHAYVTPQSEPRCRKSCARVKNAMRLVGAKSRLAELANPLKLSVALT